MALQYVANTSLMEVELASNYTAGSGTMTLVDGSLLPTTGNFWLRAENTTNFFKCTARTGNVITVAADSDYSPDANQNSGTKLKWSLNKAAMDELYHSIVQFGTYASKPSVVNGLYRCTDSIYEWIGNGSTEQAYAFGMPVTVPPVSGWSWDNQGAATIDSSKGYHLLHAPAGIIRNLRVRYRSAPATPYTITAVFVVEAYAAATSFSAVGFGFRQGSSGSLTAIGSFYDGGIHRKEITVDKWTNPTTYNSTYVSGDHVRDSNILVLQIQDNGSSRIYASSSEGLAFPVLYTVTRTDFLTADQIFFYAEGYNNIDNNISLISYTQS